MLQNERDEEQQSRGDQARFERHPRRGTAAPRRLHGEEIEAEEDAGDEAVGVADRAAGPDLKALGEQRAAARDAQS